MKKLFLAVFMLFSVLAFGQYSPFVEAKGARKVVSADSYAGSDCGAKINAADAAWAGVSVEIEVNQACGRTWTTPIALTSGHNLKFIQAGTYVVPPLNQFAGNNDISGLGAETIVQVAAQKTCPGFVPPMVHGCNLPPDTRGGTYYVNGSNVTFHDLTLDGNMTAQAGTIVKGIVIMAGVRNPTIRNVRMTNWSYAALTAIGDEVTINRDGSQTITAANPIVNLQIIDSTFNNFRYDAISVIDVEGIRFVSNTCSNTGMANGPYGSCFGYELTATRHNLIVQDNTFSTNRNNNYGLAQGASHPQFGYQDCTISGNKFTNGGVGIECNRATITNNTFENPLGSGSGNWRQGVEFYGSDAVIEHNSISCGTILFGVFSAGYPVSHVRVERNTITNGGKSPACIMVGGTASKTYDAMNALDVIDNLCDLTRSTLGGNGIHQFAGQVITNLNISGNTILGNSNVKGITSTAALPGSGPWTITGNKLRGLSSGFHTTVGHNLSELNVLSNDITGTASPVSFDGGVNPRTYRNCGNQTSGGKANLTAGCGPE